MSESKAKNLNRGENIARTNGKIIGSFIWILSLIFIALKLTNNISWEWIWILSPFWIGISLIILVSIPITLYYAAEITKVNPEDSLIFTYKELEDGTMEMEVIDKKSGETYTRKLKTVPKKLK